MSNHEDSDQEKSSNRSTLIFVVLVLAAGAYVAPEKAAWIGGMVVVFVAVIWVASNQQKAKTILTTILQLAVVYVVIMGIALLLGLFIKV